jgi:DNA/RNA-binding domain of Phe-tRNA-synthetase-like protein
VSDGGEPSPIPLSLQRGLAGCLRIGTLRAAPVSVVPTTGELAREIEGIAADMRGRFSGRSPAEIAELAPARELYRAFGIDPTKMRPSSEKLLRRVLQDRPLPRISNAVDLGNLLALLFHLPIGLYDASKLDGPVEMRRGLPDESFVGIASQDVHLQGRPVLADRKGPFGNPTADSKRTAVEASTRSLWLTVFAPTSFPVSRLEAHMQTAAESFRRHLTGPDAPVHAEIGLVE